MRFAFEPPAVNSARRPHGCQRVDERELLSGGANTRISILQNVGAEEGVHKVLPEAQVMQIDTQANVIAALEAGRVDGAAVELCMNLGDGI